jgi:type IV secretion system protein VirB9
MRQFLFLSLLLAGPAAAQSEARAAGELPPLPAPDAATSQPAYQTEPSLFARPTRNTDPRLREVVYDPNEVVQLTVAPARQTTILFAGGEKIVSVAVGDSNAWQVIASRAGDSLFVKPVTTYGATNMTVITDARIYLFDLVTGASTESTYLLRFVYPEHAGAPGGEPPVRLKAGVYSLRGARVLRPKVVRDDGAKTYLQWAEGQAMPAVFALTPSGDEMLVDGYMRGHFYTLDRVYNELIFRFDDKMASAVRK